MGQSSAVTGQVEAHMANDVWRNKVVTKLCGDWDWNGMLRTGSALSRYIMGWFTPNNAKVRILQFIAFRCVSAPASHTPQLSWLSTVLYVPGILPYLCGLCS